MDRTAYGLIESGIYLLIFGRLNPIVLTHVINQMGTTCLQPNVVAFTTTMRRRFSQNPPVQLAGVWRATVAAGDGKWQPETESVNWRRKKSTGDERRCRETSLPWLPLFQCPGQGLALHYKAEKLGRFNGGQPWSHSAHTFKVGWRRAYSGIATQS